MASQARRKKCLEKIKSVRFDILAYLGKRPHIASEMSGIYEYPDDCSGRLAKMQAMIGQFPINDDDRTSEEIDGNVED